MKTHRCEMPLVKTYIFISGAKVGAVLSVSAVCHLTRHEKNHWQLWHRIRNHTYYHHLGVQSDNISKHYSCQVHIANDWKWSYSQSDQTALGTNQAKLSCHGSNQEKKRVNSISTIQHLIQHPWWHTFQTLGGFKRLSALWGQLTY